VLGVADLGRYGPCAGWPGVAISTVLRGSGQISRSCAPDVPPFGISLDTRASTAPAGRCPRRSGCCTACALVISGTEWASLLRRGAQDRQAGCALAVPGCLAADRAARLQATSTDPQAAGAGILDGNEPYLSQCTRRRSSIRQDTVSGDKGDCSHLFRAVHS
jgi:hypothetical protein